MLVYIIVIVLIIFFQLSLPSREMEERRDKIEAGYLKVICLILTLLAALRGVTVGTDTLSYMPEYLNMSSISFVDIFERYSDYPGYYLLAKTCSLLHFPVQVLFGLVEGIYVLAIYRFIMRYSSDKLYSIMGFMVIGLFAFSMAGLKQTLAMAFVLLYHLDLCDNKYIRAIVFAIVAYFCHKVSLIFLAGVALYYIRNFRFFYMYLFVIAAIVLLGTQFIWGELLSLLENDHYSLYESDEGYSSTSMIIYGVLLAILFLFSGQYRRLRAEDAKIMLGMSTFAFVFQAFSFVSSATFRLSFFFLPFMVVAFPNDFNCIRNAELRRWVRIGVEVILIFVFIYTNRKGGSIVPYKFFWQG